MENVALFLLADKRADRSFLQRYGVYRDRRAFSRFPQVDVEIVAERQDRLRDVIDDVLDGSVIQRDFNEIDGNGAFFFPRFPAGARRFRIFG